MPTFPLCVEALDFASADVAAGNKAAAGKPGSFAAIGTFNPAIEIFDLDVLEVLEPDVVLGGPLKASASGRRRNGAVAGFKEGSHTGAIMALSWNHEFRNLLASGSADGTAKIWDLATQQCRRTFQHHKNKVQSVVWNPAEQNILATGSFDRTIATLDARTPGRGARFKLPSDIEDLKWNPYAPFQFVAACEDGTLLSHDIRKPQAPLFCFKAHKKAVSAISFSQYVPGLLATCSTDMSVKIFDLLHASQLTGVKTATGKVNAPTLVVSKTMNVGPLFSVEFFPGQPFLLATAGELGMVAVWETTEESYVSRCFSGARVREAPPVYPNSSKASTPTTSQRQ